MSALEKVFYSPAGQARRQACRLPPSRQRCGAGARGRPARSSGAARKAAQSPRTRSSASGAQSRNPSSTHPATPRPGMAHRIGAIVVDATEVAHGRRTRGNARSLAARRESARGVRTGRSSWPGPAAARWEAHAVARALDGINRTVGKELRRGATSNLVYVDPVATTGGRGRHARDSCSRADPRSSMASRGRIGAAASRTWRWRQPLADKVIVVTGAARGIGASICTDARP